MIPITHVALDTHVARGRRIRRLAFLLAALALVGASLLASGCTQSRLVVSSTGEDLGEWLVGTTAHNERVGEAIDFAGSPLVWYELAFCDGNAAVATGDINPPATAVIGSGSRVLRYDGPSEARVWIAPRSFSRVSLVDSTLWCADHVSLPRHELRPLVDTGFVVEPHPPSDLAIVEVRR